MMMHGSARHCSQLRDGGRWPGSPPSQGLCGTDKPAHAFARTEHALLGGRRCTDGKLILGGGAGSRLAKPPASPGPGAASKQRKLACASNPSKAPRNVNPRLHATARKAFTDPAPASLCHVLVLLPPPAAIAPVPGRGPVFRHSELIPLSGPLPGLEESPPRGHMTSSSPVRSQPDATLSGRPSSALPFSIVPCFSTAHTVIV
ncbi:hypothetical protein HJG60_011790 [Phyllostomus discolor]|uniref:Uncharacterized protein n=1 Tax=Phyllostomus discolor TaxID=89673 RepID=A0A833ZIL7_9CHIR|nr:hypothetical protein HJG60_011790 [Phyllostomus discolor]